MKLATYKFGRFWNKITLELFSDRIVVRGKDSRGSLIEDEIKINAFSGKKLTIYAKDDIKMAVFGLPGIVIFIGSIYFWEKMAAHNISLFYAVIFGSIVLMLIGFVFAKRSKFYGYKNDNEQVILSIAEHGNKREYLEAFIRELDNAIKAQQGSGANG